MTNKPYSLLVIAPSWVGDMVMAQSLFIRLKEQNPNIVIDVLAPAWTHPLLSHMPEVRQGILMPLNHGVLGLKTRYRLAKILKLNHYDQAIVLTNTWKSALIPFFAGIPKRTGWHGECRWGLLNDRRILNKKKLPLLIDQYAALAYPKEGMIDTKASKPALVIKPEIIEKTLEKYALNTDHKHPILIICPGAEGGSAKRWPESYFAILANTKIAEGWQVWLMGSKNDKPIASVIKDTITQQNTEGCIDLTGQTDLHEAIALLSIASQVVANDSGLMHVAAALNTPVIGIFGPTDPHHTPPLSIRAKTVSMALSCSPCFKRVCPLGHHRCMHDLTPAQVLAAFDKELAV